MAAFLIEAALFLATGSEAARSRLGDWAPWKVAAVLTGITSLTWLLAGGSDLRQFAGVTAIAGVLAFWYLVFPASDVPLLFLYGAVALTKASTLLYPIPWEKAPTPIIGELAWLRTLLFAVLVFRRPGTVGYGFVPTREEWKQGLRWFALFLPVALIVGIPIGFARLRTLPDDPLRVVYAVVGTFLGHYIFVALREEFLFRGMLLPLMQRGMGATAGLAASAVLFGMVHLPFGQFPNWRFALVATAAGYFYGRSYLATGSIRSAMITHALTNVVARVFLST